MKFIDSHAHLDFEDFHKDFEAVLSRATEAGVDKIINIGADLERSKASVLLAEHHSNIFATVGVHPDEATSVDFDYVSEELERLIKSSRRVVAVGECGLDYYRIKNDCEKKSQKELFKLHIEIAKRHNLPLIIHIRNGEDSSAFTDTLEILEQGEHFKGVIHCFTLGATEAKIFTSLGFSLGFTGIITYKNADDIRSAVSETELGKIFIETDCPFLAPQKYRGERNEPAHVVEVAKKIAEIKNTTLENIALQTTNNVLELFHLK